MFQNSMKRPKIYTHYISNKIYVQNNSDTWLMTKLSKYGNLKNLDTKKTNSLNLCSQRTTKTFSEIIYYQYYIAHNHLSSLLSNSEKFIMYLNEWNKWYISSDKNKSNQLTRTFFTKTHKTHLLFWPIFSQIKLIFN